MQALINFEKKQAPKKLTILRLVVGAIFIVHGLAKFGMWEMSPSADMPVAMLWIFRILSIVEPVAGVAMVLGLFVPVVGLIFTVIMLGAIPTQIFMFQAEFAGGWAYELLILASALVLAAHGGGAWSLDDMMKKNKSAAPKPMDSSSGINQGQGM